MGWRGRASRAAHSQAEPGNEAKPDVPAPFPWMAQPGRQRSGWTSALRIGIFLHLHDPMNLHPEMDRPRMTRIVNQPTNRKRGQGWRIIGHWSALFAPL